MTNRAWRELLSFCWYVAILVVIVLAFYYAATSTGATLRIAPMCRDERGAESVGKAVIRNGRDYVVQCPDGNGGWRDRAVIPNACPKPPRTDRRADDGGIAVDCQGAIPTPANPRPQS